ncbi:MAG: replicative DNA helicase [Pseudomonadota bacterium]
MINAASRSLEAEQSIVGGLLLDNNSFYSIDSIIEEKHFFVATNRILFLKIKEMVENNESVDVVTLSDKFENNDVIDLCHIGTLAKNTPSSANIIEYANIVVAKWQKRELVIHATNAIADAENTGKPISEIINSLHEQLACSSNNSTDLIHIKDALSSAIDKVDEQFHSDEKIAGVSTGFEELNSLISGFQNGRVYTIAARPSMGKSALAQNFIENMSANCLKGINFSFEMNSTMLALRHIASVGRVNFGRLISAGNLEDNDWPRITSAVGMLADRDIHISDKPNITINELTAIVRQKHKEINIDYIVVDHIGLMSGKGDAQRNISEITKALKILALDLDIIVIQLSQLNRNLESRPDKRPVVSDLRDSGSIEQDSDIVMFIYRDDVYNPDSEYRGTAEIIIAKNRDGPLGTVKLAFTGKYVRFDEINDNF